MAKPDHNVNLTRFGIASFVMKIMAASEHFGGRYQYSPRLMLLGAIFTAVKFSRSSLAR
jgi:hypothetical protein